MKMTAKEMFEKLGYTKTGDCEFISYETYLEKNITQEIFFHKSTWEMEIYNNMYQKGEPIKITMAELKAIQKQMEELGW